MRESDIPLFKRSKDSLTKDVLKLKKLELITEGWYKGQLIQLLDKVAGKVVVDGIVCYNTNIVINGYTNRNNNSERAKNIQKLLKLFGLDDTALDNIYHTWSNNQLDGIQFNFDKEENYDKVFSLDDFKETYRSLRELISNAQTFELVHNNTKYLETDTERPPIPYSEWYGGSAWIEDSMRYESNTDLSENGSGTTYTPIRDYSAGQIMHYSSLKIFDTNGIDITSSYSNKIVDAVKMLLLFSGNNFMQRDSITKLSETIVRNEESENYVIVETKETYTKNYNITFSDNEFWKYKNGSLKLQKYLDDGTYLTRDIIAFDYWDIFLYLDSFDNDESNDLFYISKRKISVFSSDKNQRRLTVNGIKNHSAKEIVSGLTKYADFKILVPRKKNKFLGMGGFVGGFLGGLFNAIVKVVAVVARILSYVPVFRVQFQIIAWIFSGEWSNDQKRVEQVGTRVLLAAIAAVIIVLTGGGAIQIAISLLTSAYSMYTGLKAYDDLVESMKKKEQGDTTVSEQEIYDKLIDFSKEQGEGDLFNNSQYKPFEKIRETYKSPFSRDSIYNHKMGL